MTETYAEILDKQVPATHPTAEQTGEIAALWRYCFQDKEEFVQWYFQDYYKPEHTYILTEPEQGHITAALQCNPYTLTIRNAKVPAAYLVGICTHPAYRGNGHFRRLFTESLQQLAQTEASLAFLQPIDSRLYTPYDFTYTYYKQDYTLAMTDIRDFCQEKSTSPQGENVMLLSKAEEHWQQLQEIYQAYHKQRHGYVCRTEENWRQHITDWQIDKAHIALFTCQDQAIAYLVYQLENNQINILEMAYKEPTSQKMLWRYLYQHHTQADKICWSSPIEDRLIEEIPRWQGKCALHPDMMTRILSVEKLLPTLTYPQEITGAICLAVTDNIITANNGTFSLGIYQGFAAVRKMESPANIHCALSISTLTRLVMGQVTATELAAQGLLTGAESQIQLLEKLFPKKQNFINESF